MTELVDELRSYFALTTATPLPRRVAAMSARSLPAHRNRGAAGLAATAAVLATTGLVLLVGQLVPRSGGGASSGLSVAGGDAFRPAIVPAVGDTISYPGVDTTALAGRGIHLDVPAGQAAARLTAAQAQDAARGAVGAGAGTAGPAVLASAAVVDRYPPLTCLCWVVDVPVAIENQGPGPNGPHTRLVLVDSVTGRVVAALSGSGIP